MTLLCTASTAVFEPYSAHDFDMYRTHSGRTFRMLTGIDEYAPESLAVVDIRFRQ